MKKTYITTMPDHIGAFLKASECFAKLNINITRVSYNKAVDTHTLFIDAEGSREQLDKTDSKLTEIGYLNNNQEETSVVLIEFLLKDVPGSVTEVLRLINRFNFNISYISSQENGTQYQSFKMGLFVNDTAKISEFLALAGKLCQVKVIDYNHSEKIYDNSIFYNSFVQGLVKTFNLSEKVKAELLVNTNLAMQTLDERGLSPYKTFDSISRFGELLAKCRGTMFVPRITTHEITKNTSITLIEPACGSNTAIISSNGNYLFIDSGYALYQNEMVEIFNRIIPNFSDVKKTILVTHADVDHCGLLNLFDEVITSKKTAECLIREWENKNGYREENPLHKPYITICKILTSYRNVNPEKIKVLWGDEKSNSELLTPIGFFDFGELKFEVYEGKGGHLAGETVLIDYEHRVAFTGDIYVNTHEMTTPQAEYNKYAPILMTSVDTDPKLCALERSAILQRLGSGRWQLFGAHGYKKEINVSIE